MFKIVLSQRFEIGNFHIKIQISGFSQKFLEDLGTLNSHYHTTVHGCLEQPSSLNRQAFAAVPTGPYFFTTVIIAPIIVLF
jgi:hypothetical protein